jgi:hypothetical protein
VVIFFLATKKKSNATYTQKKIVKRNPKLPDFEDFKK